MNMLLTIHCTESILPMPLTHSAVGIGVPKTNGVSRLTAVFLCAKSQFHIIMSNWVEQSQDWLDSFVPVRQFYPVRLHNWRYVVGFKTLQTEAVMPKFNAQKPTPTAIALVETSAIIGSVADSNGLFTQQLSDRIDSYGTPLSELTVFQLIDLINKHRTEFNNQKAPTKKTSRFNVLDSKKQLIAKNLAFDQAKKYRNCTVKFSCMSEVL